MKPDSSTHLKNPANIINLTTVGPKPTRNAKRRKTTTAAHLSPALIPFRFSGTVSSSSDSLRLRHTARTAILAAGRAFKLESNLNDAQFITSFIIRKSFADRYSAIVESESEELDDTLGEATIKALKAIGALLSRIYDHSEEMDARLNAIIKDANDGVESELSIVKLLKG